MTIRKLFALLAVLGILAAACGDSDDSADTTAAPVATTAAPVATTAAPVATTAAPVATTAAPASAIGSADDPIQVLFVPSVSAEEIIAGGEILAEALNATTGLTFEVSVGTSYASTIEEMCASPDNTIGFIPAQGYILASDLCGVDMQLKSLRFGYTEYWTQFIVPRDSDANDIFDFAGAKWAYPDATSTSGFLVPSGIFQKFGIKVGESFEAGGHSAVVRAIYNGEADFGTTFYSPTIDADDNVIWDGTEANADVPEEAIELCVLDADGQIDCDGVFPRDARRNIREEAPDVIQNVRIVTLSDPIPNDGMAFGPEFPEDLKADIVAAMVAFADSDPDAFSTAFDAYSWSGVAPTDDSEFDSIRALLQALGFTLEDF
jgi:phosphonate transport system substrate-binding protein